MKGNNEFERNDIAIDREMEVDCDIGQEITVYIETWFDADKKFGTHTNGDDGSWVNMYGKYNPFADTLRIEVEVDTDDDEPNKWFDYEPTTAESQLIKSMIAEKIREMHGQTPQEFCNDVLGEEMTIDIFHTENRYDLILADPPWKQSKGGKKSVRANSSGRPLDYQVCTLEEIEEHLKAAVSLTGGGNSILFLWTIDKYLFEAQEIAERLGYKLHARLIWNKVTGIPAAFTVRYGHEYLLYMYKGKLRPVALEERGKIHTVFTERVQRHSQKPEISFDIIERLYPTEKKIELYARRTRPGWDCWGNEV